MTLLAACTSFGGDLEGDRKERVASSPNYKNGSFKNQDFNIQETDISASMLWEFYFGGEKGRVPQAAPEIVKPDIAEQASQELNATWIGHSSVLLELEGKYILIDPVFSQRASPFSIVGPRRFHASPVSAMELPPIDTVVISHDHYDHLDHQTILDLAGSVQHFLVPLGVGAHLESWGIDGERIIELDWWEHADISNIHYTATPAQHFSGRGLTDKNSTLWASWSIKGQSQSVYYSGDSGWFDGFKQIGDRLGPFDMTLMHIGAYDKSWEAIHMTPEQAIQAHLDVRGGIFLPVHWGTFNLAMHSWTDPIERTLKAGENSVQIATPRPGERIGLGNFVSKRWWMDEPWVAMFGAAHMVGESG